MPYPSPNWDYWCRAPAPSGTQHGRRHAHRHGRAPGARAAILASHWLSAPRWAGLCGLPGDASRRWRSGLWRCPGPEEAAGGIAAVAGGSSVCGGSLWALSSRGGAGEAVPSVGEVEENSVLPRAPRQSPEELVCTQPNQLPQVLHLEKYIFRFQPQILTRGAVCHQMLWQRFQISRNVAY